MINLVNNGNIDKSILKQVLNNKNIQNDTIKYIQKILKDELGMVLFSVTKIIESNNNLIVLESLYNTCNDIIGKYKQLNKEIANINPRIEHVKIRQRLEEISVILSEALENKTEKDQNDITIEREMIIQDGIADIRKVFETNIKLSSHYQYEGIQGYEEMITKILESYDRICSQSQISGNQLYLKTIRNLNSVEYRNVLTHYMEEIVKRRRELSKMLPLDLLDLKRLACEDEEYSLFEEVIIKINHLKKEVDKSEKRVFAIMNEKELNDVNDQDGFSKFFQKDLFEDNIRNSKELISIFDSFQLNKYNIIYELYQHISSELNVAMSFGMKEIYNDSDAIKLLSCDVVKEIKSINKDLETLKFEEINNEQNIKIIKGIIESVQIKCDILKNENDAYSLTKQEDIVTYEKRLMDYIEEIEENLELYFKESVENSSKSFVKAEDQYNRIFRNIKEINIKYDMQHLKNVILSEISTYEEILQYSVPKLLESEEKLVQTIANRLIKGSNTFAKSIIASGVEIIEPQIGDKFDGNSHEVITTKQMEKYSKGMICDVHSKGYKYMWQIIKRANVSVAL